MRESDIVHERGSYWVARFVGKSARYQVFRNALTHAESDSDYKLSPDGLSLAMARVDYLARREGSRLSAPSVAKAKEASKAHA